MDDADVRRAYWECLDLAGDITPEQCRVDVATQNVLLVLTKATPGFWGISATTTIPPASTAFAPMDGVVRASADEPTPRDKLRLHHFFSGDSPSPSAFKAASEIPTQPAAVATNAPVPAAQTIAATTPAAAAPKQTNVAPVAPVKSTPPAPAPAPVILPAAPNLRLQTDLLFELD